MDNEQKQASSIEGMRDRILPSIPGARKAVPMARGLLDYFPNALAEVAHVSFVGNQQHNPGEELHWDKEKSTDHADCIMRHLLERGTHDTDGMRHSAKIAWRALALLQIEIEKAEEEGCRRQHAVNVIDRLRANEIKEQMENHHDD